MGEAPFEGVWFGEKHPTRKGAFWWRKLLQDEPSQDELWEELDRECIRLSHTGEVVFLTEEAKKRFQITKKRQ